MRYMNDPVAGDLPRPGSDGVVLVAQRDACGEARLWEPGGDAQALVDFVGDTLVALNGEVYARQPDRSLRPADFLKSSMVVVKPPAGDIFWLEPGVFSRRYARVETGLVAMPTGEPAKRGPGRPKGSTNKPKAGS